MGRVHTKNVKKSSCKVIEKYNSRTTLDFQKRPCKKIDGISIYLMNVPKRDQSVESHSNYKKKSK
ncbi:hypothetical protein Bca4012_084602 [Brassica carinata]|uniref:Uncharacterized protein n=1 Tax=Brassica carinata TaxID=52824 RepID=A0A8X7SKU0_BRACI|nr:hypothetical protein Bca52824_026117 [Brassica carinata]